MDTIYAQATAPGRAGVSVLRISGADAFVACERLAGIVPKPRIATLCEIRRQDSSILDTALVLTFPGPRSFTGEDVVELHLHGSTAIVDATLNELSFVPGFRMAEPGEFTRRALQNGKMDLTQVEGLSDLIEAQTEVQRQQAQAVASGQFRCLVDDLRSKLVRAAALLEAVIDFADEDVPEDVSEEVVSLLDQAMAILRKEVDGQQFAERIRNGFEIAIVGAPNAGKSSLLNVLAGRDVAITSEYAGTTRDVIEVQMNIDGIPATLIDTAGLRDADDPVERLGIERAHSRADRADIRVLLVAPDVESKLPLKQGDIVLKSKADLFGYPEDGISAHTGHGVDDLVAKLGQELKSRVGKAGLATRERHLRAFSQSLVNLDTAKGIVLGGSSNYDIGAEEIRSALNSLDIVIGQVDVENLLDVVFSSFCLGK